MNFSTQTHIHTFLYHISEHEDCLAGIWYVSHTNCLPINHWHFRVHNCQYGLTVEEVKQQLPNWGNYGTCQLKWTPMPIFSSFTIIINLPQDICSLLVISVTNDFPSPKKQLQCTTWLNNMLPRPLQFNSPGISMVQPPGICFCHCASDDLVAVLVTSSGSTTWTSSGFDFLFSYQWSIVTTAIACCQAIGMA